MSASSDTPSPDADPEAVEAGFNPNALDDVIHGKVRLAAMAYIAGAGTADFASLKRALKATDGNLSVHMRKLEEAGYVRVDKRFHQRRPVTRYTLTPQGVQAWTAYLDQLASMVGGGLRGE